MPVSKDVRGLSRRKVRYLMYRVQSDTSEQDGGLKKHFESQDEFDGWHNFAKTWDAGDEGEWPDGHFVAVALDESLEMKWQRTLLGLVQDFPRVESEDE